MTTPLLSEERCLRLSRACAGIVIGICALVLVGWRYDVTALKSVGPGYITMKANAASGLILLALALLLVPPRPSRLRWVLTRFLAVIAFAIGALTLAEYLSGRNLGIDELLVADPAGIRGHFPPGRLAPVTAIAFLFLASAQALSRSRFAAARKFAQGLVLTTFVLSFQALMGYVYGVRYSFGAAFYTQIALPTTVVLIVLCAGQLLAHPDEGIVAILRARSGGGVTARRLIVTAVVGPPLVNWLQLQGLQAGWYDADFGVLLRVTGNVIFFAVLVWRTSVALHETDLARSAALEALQEREARLVEAVRARDEFLSIASHELRTPLTPLRLQTQMLQNQLRDTSRGAPDLERARRSLTLMAGQEQRLSRLIDELLDVTRIGAGKLALAFEEFDLRDLVADVCEQLREVCSSANCHLTASLDEAVPGRWDRRRLEQVVTNLLTNAVKYAPEKAIRVRLRRIGERAELRVEDDGIGIAEADHARIFARFERAVSSRNYGGLGLGLYITSEIVGAHGGEIRVESAVGKGAVFIVTLPLAHSANPVTVAAEAAVSSRATTP